MTIEETAELINENEAPFIGYAVKLTGDYDEGYDLFADSRLKALENSNKYEENGKFIGYFHTIMKFQYLNRVNKYKGFQDLSYNTEEDDFEFPSDINIEKNYHNWEIRNAVSKVKSKIHRQTLQLHLMGYKVKEIADKHECSVWTVRRRIKETNKQFKKFKIK